MIINNYFIKKVYNEEILYLDISFEEEFAKLNSKNKKEKLDKIVSDFIKKNKIKFKGVTVALMAGTMIVGYVTFNKPNSSYTINNLDKYTTNVVETYKPKENNLKEVNENNQETKVEKVNNNKINKDNNITNKVKETNKVVNNQNEIKKDNISKEIEVKEAAKEEIKENNTKINDSNTYITIKRKSGLITNIEIEEYVIGVVGAEMPASFNEETLKAQAIIARTYAVNVLNKGNILTDNSSTQNYKDNEELKKLWGSNYDKYYNKIKKAVNDTKGIYLTYDGKIIDAVYHSTSNGQTEEAKYVWGTSKPYLVSVDSPYDLTNKSFNYEKFLSYSEISKKLNMEIDENLSFEILSYTTSKRIDKIRINDKVFNGVELRNLLGLRSTDFELNLQDDGIIFKTKGYGHGVGLSQYGANGMAEAGSNYEEILLHYYKGVKLTRI